MGLQLEFNHETEIPALPSLRVPLQNLLGNTFPPHRVRIGVRRGDRTVLKTPPSGSFDKFSIRHWFGTKHFTSNRAWRENWREDERRGYTLCLERPLSFVPSACASTAQPYYWFKASSIINTICNISNDTWQHYLKHLNSSFLKFNHFYTMWNRYSIMGQSSYSIFSSNMLEYLDIATEYIICFL